MCTNIKTVILLTFLLVWGCESSIRPAKIVIYYSSFWGTHNATWTCEDLIDSKSVTITDAGAISKLWDLSHNTRILTKSEPYWFDHVICAVFYDKDNSILRKVGLSRTPLIMIDSTVYCRDVELFKAIVAYLPYDYLRTAKVGLGTDTTDTMYFYYDPQDDIRRNSEGKDFWQVRFGDSSRIPASKYTGNASDTGYFYRIPAAELTGDSTDTGFYYGGPASYLLDSTYTGYLYVNPISKIWRDGDGNIVIF